MLYFVYSKLATLYLLQRSFDPIFVSRFTCFRWFNWNGHYHTRSSLQRHI